MITVHMEPGGEVREFHSLNTVLGLMNKLGLKPGEALIIRDGALLTSDRRLRHGDRIEVRSVISSG